MSGSCTLTGFFPNFPNLPLGTIEELTFDPKFELESVGIEHVSGLELTMEGVLLSSWDRAKDISKHLKLLKETAHHLKTLTIICKNLLDLDRYCGIDSIIDIGEDSVGEYKLLKNSFGQMFKALEDRLQSVYLIAGHLSCIDPLLSDSTPITEIWIEKLDMQDYSPKNASIGICTSIAGTGRIREIAHEWAVYHRLLGVDHTWIYINSDWDDGKHPKKSYISWIPYNLNIKAYEFEKRPWTQRSEFFRVTSQVECVLRAS